MQKFRWTAIVAIVTFAAGFAVAQWGPWNAGQETAIPAAERPQADADAMELPVAARQLWFGDMAPYSGETLADADLDALLTTLRERMEAEETLADFEREAPVYMHSLVRRLAMPELTPEQSEKVYAYLDELADKHPDHRQIIQQRRELLEGFYAKANERGMPFNLAAYRWFSQVSDIDPGGETFSDADLDVLLRSLDLLLTMPATLADFESEAGIHLWRFGNRLQMGRLTDEQTARVADYFEDVAAQHPDAAEMIERNRFQVQNLLPGRTAPNIIGNDLDGVQFALNDYRDNIVVIYFSGQWCGPCRTEYPYKRFMLELYKDDPVVILGVNSDEEIETILEAKEDEGLDYRVWWDGHGEVGTEGPIAKEWNVTGWPSIYILDETGVIRYAQKRHAEVITSVNTLLWDLQQRQREQASDMEADDQTETRDTAVIEALPLKAPEVEA
ncbi:peroxiredoxin family protein [Candidatus Foliamicus sp.]